jgi:hypothetical protein
MPYKFNESRLRLRTEIPPSQRYIPASGDRGLTPKLEAVSAAMKATGAPIPPNEKPAAMTDVADVADERHAEMANLPPAERRVAAQRINAPVNDLIDPAPPGA